MTATPARLSVIAVVGDHCAPRHDGCKHAERIRADAAVADAKQITDTLNSNDVVTRTANGEGRERSKTYNSRNRGG
jgi:hypothetical protein